MSDTWRKSRTDGPMRNGKWKKGAVSDQGRRKEKVSEIGLA